MPRLLVGDNAQRNIDDLLTAVGGDVVDGDVVRGQLRLRRQIGHGAVDANFQHRHQLEVAKGFVGAGAAPLGGGQIGIGFAVHILHLSLVIARPVDHVKGIPKVIEIAGAQLKIDQGGLVGGQVVQGKLERRRFAKAVAD